MDEHEDDDKLYPEPTLQEKHQVYLGLVGGTYRGDRALTGKPREGRCHRCKKALRSYSGRACIGCSWTICVNCGSCGCEYHSYAAKQLSWP